MEINMCLRKNENIPGNTKALVFSLDGVNVLFNERGKKKAERSIVKIEL